MIPELLWIIGLYVAAAACAHAVIGRKGKDGHRSHYVLVAGNHQLQIEWYVRALQHFSRRTGTDIGITVVLEDSSDDTGLIMERFARRGAGIGLVRGCGESGGEGVEPVKGFSRNLMREQLEAGWTAGAAQHFVWVDLANREDVSRLPL